MQVNAMLTYTLSPVHTDAYYVERARELVALRADFIAVKDPTGLLTPERARTLFPALVQAVGDVPLQLHSHCQSGLAPEVYTVAIASGFRFGHSAAEPLANGASLPATEDIAARAQSLGYETGIQPAALQELSGYFDWLCVRENKPRGQVATYDPALYEHQVPGGMISNLISQLRMLDLEHQLPAILEEAAQVRRDLGYPIVVSPFAQYVVTQAVLNVVQGERYKTIPDEVRKYALGYYGRLAAPPANVFLERAKLRPEDMVSTRAGEHVESWIPRLRATLGAAAADEDILLAAFYDQALLAPLRQPAPLYQYQTSPLYELLHYLDRQAEISHARIRFGGTEITVSA
jgi:pyruvate/oxaloacetate carboxyltransferase